MDKRGPVWLTWPVAAASAGFLLPAAASLWHILSQKAPPSWDDGWYLSNSMHLWHSLRHGGPLFFIREYLQAFGIKAPLIALLPMPVYAVLGKGLAQALLTNLACIAVASFYVFRTGRLLHSPLAGVLAVWCLNTTPIVYGVSRIFFVEASLLAVVAAYTYYLLAGRSGRQLGVCLGLGMLSKVSFPLYVALPTLLLALRRRTVKDWLWTAGIGAAIAGPWYALNASTVLSFALSAGYGKTAANFETGSTMLHYFFQVSRQCWSHYYVLLAAGAATASLALKPRPAQDRWRLAAAVLLGGGLLPLLVFAASINRTYRYTAPALALLAIGLGVLLAHLWTRVPERFARLGWGAVPLLFLMPLFMLWEQTVGSRLPGDPRGAGEPVFLDSNGPPSVDWDRTQQHMLFDVAKDANRTPGKKIVVIGLQSRYFNEKTAEFWAELHGWPVRFGAFQHKRTPGAAVEYLDRVIADYVVLAEDWPQAELPPFLNKHNLAVRKALESGELPFELWRSGKLGNGANALVYRRK
ncbi:ArnT family glycosyltransferase [Elusimicrobiota bacterium]